MQRSHINIDDLKPPDCLRNRWFSRGRPLVSKNNKKKGKKASFFTYFLPNSIVIYLGTHNPLHAN